MWLAAGRTAARKSISSPGAFRSVVSILSWPSSGASLRGLRSPSIRSPRPPNGGRDYLFNTAGFTL